jgi:hypothetical protein
VYNPPEWLAWVISQEALRVVSTNQRGEGQHEVAVCLGWASINSGGGGGGGGDGDGDDEVEHDDSIV